MKKFFKGLFKLIILLVLLFLAYAFGEDAGRRGSRKAVETASSLANSAMTTLNDLADDKENTQQTETRQTEARQTDAPQGETQQAVTAQAETRQDESGQAETQQTEAAQSSTRSGIRPEFKQAMDDYEAFFNEYCNLMEKAAASPDDLSILASYADYMARFADTMSSMEALEDDEDLSTEELAYYIEVTARIETRLLQAAQ